MTATRIIAAGVFVVSWALAGPAYSAHSSRAPDYCQAYARESAEREAQPTGQGPKVAVLGDSYSLGVGLKDTAQGWTSHLPGRVQVFGFGGSGFGRTSSPCGVQVSFAERALHVVASHPDLVVVEGGLNDVRQEDDAVREGLRAVLAITRGIPTLVIGPAPAPKRVDGARRVDALLKEEAARAGVQYLSMIDEDFVYLGDKQLHINLDSHRAYGANVVRALRRTAPFLQASERTPDRSSPPAVGMTTSPTGSRPAPTTSSGIASETPSAAPTGAEDTRSVTPQAVPVIVAVGLGVLLSGCVIVRRRSRRPRLERRH